MELKKEIRLETLLIKGLDIDELHELTELLKIEREEYCKSQLNLCEVMQPLIELSLNDIVVYTTKKPAVIIEELEHDFVNIKNEKGEIIKKYKGDLEKAKINVA
jgi:hypothetical protein